jgi:hypothetical protein
LKKTLPLLFALLLLGLSTSAHAQLDFTKWINPGPLASPHSSLEGVKNCTQCHATAQGVPDEKCLNCHKEIAQRIEQRKGYHSRVTGQCISCHGDHKGPDYDITGLSRMAFDHTDTGWPLTGKHEAIDCPKCHTKSRKNIVSGAMTQRKTYLGNNSNCKACHADPHKSKKAAFQQCYKCHDTTSWTKRENSNFNHSKDTKFTLDGRHAEIQCFQCHKVKTWQPMNMACVACHADPHDGSFGKVCQTCHNTRTFKEASAASAAAAPAPKSSGSTPSASAGAMAGAGATGGKAKSVGPAVKISKGFDHNKTAFPLTGKHIAVTCKTCHGPIIAKMENFEDCSGCHKNPHGNQFQTLAEAKPCSSCHVTAGFKKLSFDHNKNSRFEILGKHKQVKCNQCHVKGRYRWLTESPDCDTCHKDPHKGQFEPKTCASCHTYDGFKMSKALVAGVQKSGGGSAPVNMAGFNHEQTGFPLVGKHQAVACETCHEGGKFKGIGRTCNSCHNDFHKGELGFECERCHSPAIGFNDVEFNHNREAKFRIDGMHTKNQCYQCHNGFKFKMGDFNCSTCHIDIHKGQFGTACDKCHTTSGFYLPSGFHEFGSFRIEGVHDKLDCTTCHNPKAPARPRATDCQSCHRDPHMNSLGTQCSQCHGQISWLPSKFRHNQTGFELSGAHRFLSCNQCHFNRVFGGLSSECVFCHFKDFNSGLPQHAGAPTTCNTCHFTFGFRPAK